MTEVRAVLRHAGTQWVLAVPDTVVEAAGWRDGQAVTAMATCRTACLLDA